MPKLSELKARKTLMSVGLDASKFELACSVTNEVWLTETHAVRFNKAGDGRLRREAFLARHLPHVDTTLMSDVSLLVHENAQALDPFDGSTLVHGDLTFENILWDGRNVTMLDYEWSQGAPADVDLDILLRCCALPFLHVAPAYE